MNLCSGNFIYTPAFAVRSELPHGFSTETYQLVSLHLSKVHPLLRS